MIRAVTFDFWNTIAQLPPGAMSEARRRAVAAACEAGGAEVEAELLVRGLEDVGLRWERSWAAGSHLHPHEGAEILVRSLGVEGAAREMVAAAFLEAGREVKLRLAPHIGACLRALRDGGLRLGIVCDVGFSGGALLRELLEAEGLLGCFDGWGFSDEVGEYKPSPRIFEAALSALGAAPREALHVGDLRRTDVAGAAGIGMRTVRYAGMHDDRDPSVPVEAEAVVHSHRELPPLVLAERGAPLSGLP